MPDQRERGYGSDSPTELVHGWTPDPSDPLDAALAWHLVRIRETQSKALSEIRRARSALAEYEPMLAKANADIDALTDEINRRARVAASS